MYKAVLTSALLLMTPLVHATETDLVLAQNETPFIADHKWFERIQISGLFLGEAIYSNYNQALGARFAQEAPYSTFCFPRANLLMDAQLDTWVSSHFAFNFRDSCGYGNKNDEWAFTKFGRTDEAYVTLLDEKVLPMFARIGIQYLPYGNYIRHRIPATFTQLLTQTQNAGISFGMANASPFNATGYVFSSKPNRNGTQHINNTGVQLSYLYKHNPDLTANVNLGWMYNIAGAVDYLVQLGNPNSTNPLNAGYRKAVGGASLSAIINYRAWDTTLQATSALVKFNPQDLSWKNSGAQPSAFIIDAGYKFKQFKGKHARIGGSVQESFQSVNIRGFNQGRGIPKLRLQADYDIEAWHNTRLGFHVVWDQDFSIADGGTGRNSLATLLGLLVRI